MPDVWATLADASVETQELLATVLDTLGSEPAAQASLRDFLSEIDFPQVSKVLEIGCGTGRVVRALLNWPNVVEAVGIDPSAVFIEKARAQTTSEKKASFAQMDGKKLLFPESEFDAVVMVRVLVHAPGAEQILAEAQRVLRPGGVLAILEVDPATSSVAIGEHDPLQNCLDAARTAYMNDPWIVRRLPKMLETAGFDFLGSSSHSEIRTSKAALILNQIGRGTDALVASGCIGPDLAAALREEARQRVEAGRFYGVIGQASFIGRKLKERANN